MSQCTHIVPILSVRNVPESISFYIDKLGFKKDWDWGNPATFASVSLDGAAIFLCQGVQGQPGSWLSVFVPNVDALFHAFRARGVNIRQPPTNFPWGTREMNVQDPDGHRLRFGSDATGPSDGVRLVED
jgi:uncharacterized glyoxalase superfamily protein PhnB